MSFLITRDLGPIAFSEFDEVLKLPNGQTVAELKTIARQVASQNPKIKLTHAVTTLVNGAGMPVRDLDQAYPILMQRALRPWDDTLQILKIQTVIDGEGNDAIVLFDQNELAYPMSFGRPSNAFFEDDTRSDDEIRQAIVSRLKVQMRGIPPIDPAEPKKFAAAVSKLARLAVTDSAGGVAAAEVLLSLRNGHAWPASLTSLRSFDHHNLDAAVEAIRYSAQNNTDPRTVIDNGDQIFDRIALAHPMIYRPLRAQADFLDEQAKVEVWKCPHCHRQQQRLQHPNWLQAAAKVPWCERLWDDDRHPELDESDMRLEGTYPLVLKKPES